MSAHICTVCGKPSGVHPTLCYEHDPEFGGPLRNDKPPNWFPNAGTWVSAGGDPPLRVEEVLFDYAVCLLSDGLRYGIACLEEVPMPADERDQDDRDAELWFEQLTNPSHYSQVEKDRLLEAFRSGRKTLRAKWENRDR